MTQVLPTPIVAESAPVRLCDYGGVRHLPATRFTATGAWCSLECERYDRGSEVRVWRQASGLISAVTL